MSDYDDYPMPTELINRTAYCFYCGTTAHRSHDGKWMCDEHYDEKVRSKFRHMHNAKIEVEET